MEIKEVLEPCLGGRRAQPSHRVLLEPRRAGAGDVEHCRHLDAALGRAVVQSVDEAEHVALDRRQLELEQELQLRPQRRHVAQLRGLRLAAAHEVDERAGRPVLLGERQVERDRRGERGGVAHARDVHSNRLGQLLFRRRAPQLRGEHRARLLEAHEEVVDVHGQPDRPRLAGERARDALPYPVGGVRGEAELPLRVEQIGRADQAEVALLDEVLHQDALVGVPLGDPDDQPQVALEHLLARRLASPQLLLQLRRREAQRGGGLLRRGHAAEAPLELLLLRAQRVGAAHLARQLDLLLLRQHAPRGDALHVPHDRVGRGRRLRRLPPPPRGGARRGGVRLDVLPRRERRLRRRGGGGPPGGLADARGEGTGGGEDERAGEREEEREEEGGARAAEVHRASHGGEGGTEGKGGGRRERRPSGGRGRGKAGGGEGKREVRRGARRMDVGGGGGRGRRAGEG
mmetsp:Transcript_5868/g.14889  ORF Transcript_5868/g.14889 Transcript_5868/m.14889 type:complete len:459 (+) Transcript_5868:507-1883(+)